MRAQTKVDEAHVEAVGNERFEAVLVRLRPRRFAPDGRRAREQAPREEVVVGVVFDDEDREGFGHPLAIRLATGALARSPVAA